MDLVDEQDVALTEIGEKRRQISGLFNGGAGGHPQIHAHLVGDDACQGGFSQTGRAVEQYMIQRLIAPAGSLNVDREVALGLLLAGILRQGLRAKVRLSPVPGDQGGGDQRGFHLL